MTTHEILTSMTWFVAIAYIVYLAWFVRTTIRKAHRAAARRRHPTNRAGSRSDMSRSDRRS